MTTTKTFSIKTLSGAALAAAAALALPLGAAQAAGQDSAEREITISYADLNLASQAGQMILDERIEDAIVKVCGTYEGRPTFDAAVRKCQQQTRINAMQSRDLAVANYGRAQLARGERREIRLVAR